VQTGPKCYMMISPSIYTLATQSQLVGDVPVTLPLHEQEHGLLLGWRYTARGMK
jgi:hypothetical protein